ncbi:MAG TPA: permease prefix domain 1-containing protein [Verrucomicrobiae bacterium]
MENPTPFSLSEAIRRWRAEFGSPSSLSAAELEELETHLRDHVAQLESGGMTPEAAFAVATKQLGDRQRVTTEFAKINPQRVWLERAIWMAVGIFLFSVLRRLELVGSNILLSHGFARGWDPALCVALSRLGGLGSVAAMAALLWFSFSRRPNWGRALRDSCERSLLAAGVAVVLMLWGCTRLSYLCDYLLNQFAPRLHAWLYPMIQTPFADEAVMNRISFCCRIGEEVIWAVALCVLATRVVRVRRSSLFASFTQKGTANSLWLERLTWMVAGYMLVKFGVCELHGMVLLPAAWMLTALGSSVVIQHLAGLTMAVLELVLWAIPFWACWVFTAWRPKLGGWIARAFRRHPFSTSIGVMLLLNEDVILWQFLQWTGAHAKIAGSGLGAIISEWNFGAGMVWCQRVALAALLVVLMRRRMKLRMA